MTPHHPHPTIHRATRTSFSLLAAAFLLTSCGDSEKNDAGASSTSATSSDAHANPKHGQEVKANGVTLKVLSVTEAGSMDLLEHGVKVEVAATETLTPDSGGKFVVVETTVENTGKKSWDLTCGFAIQAKVLDVKDREFDPIHELDLIPGNPECNESTNPGFSKSMTWAFEVPKDAHINRFGFADPETNYDDLTFIDLAGAPSKKERDEHKDKSDSAQTTSSAADSNAAGQSQ
ncbi:DUF4352 domain-containing protein [Corynebacterium sp. 321]|uniref:DUF4352 domain-containing protein n=1 Tax=Corynebacterium sp. 321 TaxID=2651047 RepID=UPI0013017BD2|nr:DUF4352 domain-containing protein [Corynebacterium sp. 321]KAB1550674.1 DUF4352 domain-containing protein [Corynebacterium sp. 321]